MRKDCYIVYSVSKEKYSNKIVEFNFYNCFETEEQARASLQYEIDVCLYENDEEVVWVDDYTILLTEGCNPNIETIVTYDNSVNFYDKNEPLFKYE